jgi:hypothetical protein
MSGLYENLAKPIFKRCDGAGCARRISIGMSYCCASCQMASENRYEIHTDGPLGHSDLCNARHMERGPA